MAAPQKRLTDFLLDDTDDQFQYRDGKLPEGSDMCGFGCPFCKEAPMAFVTIMKEETRVWTTDYWSGASGYQWDEINICKKGHVWISHNGDY